MAKKKRKTKTVSRTISRKAASNQVRALAQRVGESVRTDNREVLHVQATFIAWLYELELKISGQKNPHN
jgi:signal recognition particle GTPase